MIAISPTDNFSSYTQYAVWLVTMVVVALGFRHVRQIIAFILDKIYDIFIEHNPLSI